MGYIFMHSTAEDLKKIYELIDSRIRWMDEKGIQQWNVTDYRKCYPPCYFEKALEDRCLYVLKNAGNVAGAVVLRETDSRWDDNTPAYYIHNLVTAIGEKGAGEKILAKCTELAADNGKACVRLDCSVTNEKLNDYYLNQGFITAGICVDGKYCGNKREKKL